MKQKRTTLAQKRTMTTRVTHCRYGHGIKTLMSARGLSCKLCAKIATYNYLHRKNEVPIEKSISAIEFDALPDNTRRRSSKTCKYGHGPNTIVTNTGLACRLCGDISRHNYLYKPENKVPKNISRVEFQQIRDDRKIPQVARTTCKYGHGPYLPKSNYCATCRKISDINRDLLILHSERLLQTTTAAELEAISRAMIKTRAETLELQQPLPKKKPLSPLAKTTQCIYGHGPRMGTQSRGKRAVTARCTICHQIDQINYRNKDKNTPSIPKTISISDFEILRDTQSRHRGLRAKATLLAADPNFYRRSGHQAASIRALNQEAKAT